MSNIEMEANSKTKEMENRISNQSTDTKDSENDDNGEVVGINDMTNELRVYGSKFIIFSGLFYLCTPLFYFWINLRWSFVDSIYVRI